MTLPALRAERARIFASKPSDVDALAASDGSLQPLGRLFGAESDMRVYGELLGALVLDGRNNGGVLSELSVATATRLVERLASRCAGWYDLPTGDRVLRLAADLLQRLAGADQLSALEETATVVDRLAMWLDSEIPWAILNDVLVEHRQ